MYTRLNTALLLSTVCLPLHAHAGEWGLGAAFAHMQAPQLSVSGETLGVPYVSYHGEHLNIDLLNASYWLFEADNFTVSLAGEFRFDGYQAKDSPSLTGMADRNPSFDTGLSMSHRDSVGELKLTWLADITGTHEGYETRLEYQVPHIINRLLIAPTLGISRLNSSLVDYYYGVRADETTITRAQYSGNATTNIYIELALGYVLSERMEFVSGFKYTWLGNNITASPIVEKNHETAAFTALQYKF